MTSYLWSKPTTFSAKGVLPTTHPDPPTAQPLHGDAVCKQRAYSWVNFLYNSEQGPLSIFHNSLQLGWGESRTHLSVNHDFDSLKKLFADDGTDNDDNFVSSPHDSNNISVIILFSILIWTIVRISYRSILYRERFSNRTGDRRKSTVLCNRNMG